MLEVAQHEPAREVVVTELAEAAGYLPGGGCVAQVGDEGRFVPVVLHGSGVVGDHRGPGAEFLPGLLECIPVIPAGPDRQRR